MFTHEKFEAYQLSIDLMHVVLRILDSIPAGHASLRDQLRRAAFSIPLNIAEGTGKSGRSDRLRFYAIARGSAMECAVICDVIAIIDIELRPQIEVAKAKLRSIVSILSTVCFSRPRCSLGEGRGSRCTCRRRMRIKMRGGWMPLHPTVPPGKFQPQARTPEPGTQPHTTRMSRIRQSGGRSLRGCKPFRTGCWENERS